MSRFGIGEIIFIITFWEQIFVVLMTPTSFFFRPQLGCHHRSHRSHFSWRTSVKRYAPQASVCLYGTIFIAMCLHQSKHSNVQSRGEPLGSSLIRH